MRLSEFDISMFGNLSELEDFWRSAEQNLLHYPFQTYDWLQNWLEASSGRDAAEPLIVVVKSPEGAVQLILPLAARKRFGLRFVSWLAADVSDYHAPLMAPEFAERCTPQDFTQLFNRIFSALPNVDIYVLPWMPEKVHDLANPMVQLPGAGKRISAFATALPATFESYLTRKRKKIHQDTLRQHKRLSEVAPVSIERVQDPGEIARTVEVMLAQKARRFPETASEADDRRYRMRRDFYTRIGRMKTDRIEGHVSRLRVADDIVATHVGVRHDKRFYYIMPSFDAEKWGKYSPGRMLMEHLIQESIENGLEAFDLTIGDEGYKKDWVDSELALYQVMGGITWAGKAYCATRDATRALRDRLRPKT